MITSLKSKKSIIIIGSLLLCAMTALGYKLKEESVVYSRVVTEENGPALTETMQGWVKNHRTEAGVSAYSYTKDGVYELILVDNRHSGPAQYLQTKYAAKQSNHTLTIEIKDIEATSEESVQYNESVYYILKEKPEVINLIINGKETTLNPEEGESAILE
jgi:hypothetical protein